MHFLGNNLVVLAPFLPLVFLAPFLSLVAVLVVWYEDSEGEKDA